MAELLGTLLLLACATSVLACTKLLMANIECVSDLGATAVGRTGVGVFGVGVGPVLVRAVIVVPSLVSRCLSVVTWVLSLVRAAVVLVEGSVSVVVSVVVSRAGSRTSESCTTSLWA